MNDGAIILHPVSSEKTIKIIETENSLVFAVARDATKPAIKAEVEKLFGAKVVKVRTLILSGATKRAVVQFSPETPAIDVATKLGLM